MVGAVPVCPPERPRSGVSIRKGYIPIRKGGISIHKRCMLTPKHVCALRRWMRPCRATRAGTQAPPLPASIKPLCHATFFIFVRRRAPRQQSFFALVRRQSLFRQPFLVLVRRRSLFRQPFLMLVRRRAPRQQPFSH